MTHKVNAWVVLVAVLIGAALVPSGVMPAFLSAQPQPGVGVFTTARVTSTAANSLDVTGGAEFGSGNVPLVTTGGKLAGLTSTYVDSVNASALTFPWSTVVYSGASFTASAGTWTVDSGDVGVNHYSLNGSTILWTIGLNATSVSSTPSALRVATPNGAVIGVSSSGTCAGMNDGTPVMSFYTATAGSAYVDFFRDLAGTLWTAASNTTSLRCTVVIIR